MLDITDSIARMYPKFWFAEVTISDRNRISDDLEALHFGLNDPNT
jgi:hypothetical protein